MNVAVNSQALAAELRLLAKVVAAKPTIPILGYVLLRAEGELHLFATDLEIAVRCACPATISEMGSIALPAKTFLDILERLPDAQVVIADGRISSGSFKSKLGTLPADDFPRMPDQPEEGKSILSASSLHALIDRVSYAISDKMQKYVLSGALLSLSGEVAAMVATDGKRLSVATAARKAGPDASVVLPSKTLGALSGQPAVGEVAFSRTDRHSFFDFGKRLIVSRMIDAEFPKYQRIIPRKNEYIVSADRAAFTAALRRVGVVSESLVVAVRPGAIELSSRNAEIGDADEMLDVQYSGPEISLHVNWGFLLDFLEHATEPILSIAIKDGKTPLLMTDGADFLNVVLPMQMSG